MEISPSQLRKCSSISQISTNIYQKIDDIKHCSTTAARAIEQLAFLLVSEISRTLLGVHLPLWKFFPFQRINFSSIDQICKDIPENCGVHGYFDQCCN